jgi:hypothetical protein
MPIRLGARRHSTHCTSGARKIGRTTMELRGWFGECCDQRSNHSVPGKRYKPNHDEGLVHSLGDEMQGFPATRVTAGFIFARGFNVRGRLCFRLQKCDAYRGTCDLGCWSYSPIASEIYRSNGPVVGTNGPESLARRPLEFTPHVAKAAASICLRSPGVWARRGA